MKNSIIVKEEQTSDCDILISKAENTIHSFENCFDNIMDSRKTKMNVVGSIFSFAFSLTKLTLTGAGCVIKNTPKAVVAVAAVKREIVADMENGWSEYQKEWQENALNEKIEQLALKKIEDANRKKSTKDFDEMFLNGVS